MSHRTLTELQNELTQARAHVVVAGQYFHYKHPEVVYIVNGLSILEATDEVAVRYSMVDDLTVEFVRPLSSWLETVEWQGVTLPRFTPIENQ
jgi:hypothetical protein